MLEAVKNYGNAFKKYGIDSDRISFDEEGNVTMHIKDVTVLCGSAAYANEKTDRISRLSTEFDGIEGILDLKDFDGTQRNLYVKTAKDTKETEESEETEDEKYTEDTEETVEYTEDEEETEDIETTETTGEIGE